MQGVRMQIALSHPSEAVYAAITNAQALESWFCQHANVDLAQNQYDFWGKFSPEAPDREQGRHRVFSYEQNQSLVYDWQMASGLTRVTYTLLPHENGTVFAVTHVPVDHEAYLSEDFWFLSLENLRRYLDGKPADLRVDFTNPMKGDVYVETEIDASPERIFEVLLRPEEVERWIATKAEIDPQVGGMFLLGWGEYPALGKIQELIPNQKLAVRGEEAMEPEKREFTVVSWELKPSGGKTRITFIHSGFAADDDTSGIYVGWHTFLNYVRSLSEYGANWQPPITLLAPGTVGYSRAINDAQDQIVDVLRQP